MKKGLTLFFVGALTLVFSGTAFAQAVQGGKSTKEQGSMPSKETGSEDKGTPPNPDVKKATGEVTSIDSKAGTLTVKADGKDMILDVKSPAAKKSLADIKIGDKVVVSYAKGAEGKFVAESVEKSKEPSTAKEKAREPSTTKKGM